MFTVTIPELKDFIVHVAIGHRDPVMLWGQPGAGKTDAVMQAATADHPRPAWLADRGQPWATKGTICDVRLGQYESVDLRGIPVPDAERGRTVWYAPITLPFVGNPDFPTDRLITLFLDEFNNCHPSVFGVAMQLTNERRIGEHILMDNVVIVCAGNREGDKGVTNRMPTTISNRLTHVEVALDVDAWCHYASGKVPAVGIAFLQFRKPLLSTFDPAKPDKAFATPRSWFKALAYYGDDTMPAHIKQAAMAGAIGQGPAAEFWGFVDVWQKMTPLSKILADPSGVALPEEASMRYATTVAVSGAMTKETVKACSTFLNRLDPEFSILAWQLAINRDRTLTATSEFIDFTKKYSHVFTGN